MKKIMPSHQPGMIYFVKDLPNICSLTGLFCALLSLYCSIQSMFEAAVVGMVWAVFFDWADGIIARKMKNRTATDSALGMHLDSLIDMISFGACPAVFLLSYGHFSPWFIPGAFIILATCAIRLSYFNIFGLIDDSTYTGLALDNNVIILGVVFLFKGMLGHFAFSIILYLLFMGLCVLNLATIPTPKFSGFWFYVLFIYTIIISFLHGMIL